MKKFILFVSLFSLGFIFAQEDMAVKEEVVEILPSTKYFGDIQGGLGFTNTSAVLYNVSAGAGIILKNNLYFRVGYDLGLGGRLFYSNSTVGYSGYNLKMGYAVDHSKKLRVVPYVGIGYNTLLRTTYRYDEVWNTANGLASGALSVVGVDTEVKNRYLTETVNAFSAPIGVNFHIHGKNAGFIVGGYMSVSKYQEFGIRLGMDFGKLQ